MSPGLNSPKSIRWNVILLGAAQLIIAAVCLFWAVTDLGQSSGETTAVNAGVWATMALGLFCLGLAQLNIIDPVREHNARPDRQRIALPVRLQPQFGGPALAYPMLSLAISFALPVIPLILLIFTPDEGWFGELSLLWIGLTITCVLIAGATTALGVQRLYQRFNASEVIVEASKEEVSPGETFKILVQYSPGRLPVESIRVRLVCEETRIIRTPVTGQNRGQPGPVAQTISLHSSELQLPAHLDPANSSRWQKSLAATIPLEAKGSTPSNSMLAITWGIEVTLGIRNAPDITERFPFIVMVPEPDDQSTLIEENSK